MLVYCRRLHGYSHWLYCILLVELLFLTRRRHFRLFYSNEVVVANSGIGFYSSSSVAWPTKLSDMVLSSNKLKLLSLNLIFIGYTFSVKTISKISSLMQELRTAVHVCINDSTRLFP